jgi:hypothetical protein
MQLGSTLVLLKKDSLQDSSRVASISLLLYVVNGLTIGLLYFCDMHIIQFGKFYSKTSSFGGFGA